MWQYGGLVFGPEADLSLSTVKQSKINVVTTNYWTVPAVNPPSSFSNLATAEASVNWIATARGRVGFALSDWLFFATGGLAVVGFDVQSTANSASSLKYNDTILGYVAGAGFQRALTPELSVRLPAVDGLVHGRRRSIGPPSAHIFSFQDSHSSLSAIRIRASPWALASLACEARIVVIARDFRNSLARACDRSPTAPAPHPQ